MINDLITDYRYDPSVIKDDLQRDLEDNHEFYEEMSVVDKPEYLKREHAAIDEQKKGIKTEVLPNPLKDMVIVELEIEKKRDSGIVLATNKKDSEFAIIRALNASSQYDFKIGDRVVIQIGREKGRLNINGIHLVLNKDFVLAVFE